MLQKGGRFNGTPYRETQARYAQRYGKSLPTIKRWWKEGKPLDDPDAMGEYLSPRGRRPNEPIVPVPADDFEGPSMVPPVDDDEDEPPPVETPVALDKSFFAGRGFLAAIERLKKAEQERSAAYFEAIRLKLPAAIVMNRFREWIGTIEPLRKLAKDEPEIRKANELTIDKAEMEAAVAHIFNGFRLAARNLPGRAAGKLVGLREHDEIVDVLEREVEVLLRALVKITLDEAAAAADAAPEPTE